MTSSTFDDLLGLLFPVTQGFHFLPPRSDFIGGLVQRVSYCSIYILVRNAFAANKMLSVNAIALVVLLLPAAALAGAAHEVEEEGQMAHISVRCRGSPDMYRKSGFNHPTCASPPCAHPS